MSQARYQTPPCRVDLVVLVVEPGGIEPPSATVGIRACTSVGPLRGPVGAGRDDPVRVHQAVFPVQSAVFPAVMFITRQPGGCSCCQARVLAPRALPDRTIWVRRRRGWRPGGTPRPRSRGSHRRCSPRPRSPRCGWRLWFAVAVYSGRSPLVSAICGHTARVSDVK